MMSEFPKTSSESPPAKMGRPRMFCAETEKIVRGILAKQIETLRTVQDHIYMGRGLKTLVGGANVSPAAAKRWGWLLRPHGGVSYCRMSIMAQLGRTKWPEALPIFADRLCRLKPNRVVEAVRLVRIWQEWAATMIAMSIVRGVRVDVVKIARAACQKTSEGTY